MANAKSFMNENIKGKLVNVYEGGFLSIRLVDTTLYYLVEVETSEKDIKWFFTGKGKYHEGYWVYVSIENGKVLKYRDEPIFL